MRDSITEHEFKLDWPKAKTLGCTNKERMKLEELIRHMMIDQHPMFLEKMKNSNHPRTKLMVGSWTMSQMIALRNLRQLFVQFPKTL